MKKTLIISAVIISVIIFFYYLSGRTANVTHGFTSYYVSSRILLEEEDFSKAYDTAYFNLKIRNYGIENVRDLPNNFPTNSLMLVPVSGLKPGDAKVIWTALNVVFYFTSILLLLNVFNIQFNTDTGLFLLVISLLFLPVYHGLQLGQAYVFLLFLFTLNLYGLKKDKTWLISVPLALIIVLKGYGLFPLIALGLLKKWKSMFTVLLTAVLIILIAVPVTGVYSWNIYFNEVLLKTGENPYASYTAFQTLNSFIRHVFGLSSYPVIALMLITASTAVFFLMKKHTRGRYSMLLIYSAFAALNILFAPIAEDYHYALLLPVVFGTGKIIFENYKKINTEIIIFIVSLFIISFPFNYKGLNNASFPLILLAYPVLYGGILMILLSVRVFNSGKNIA